jgi:1,4-dihydroxy-6-naphthoate synthase
MSSIDDRQTLRLAHSPDPDDAFMWWPLLELDGRSPRIDTGRFRFEAVTADIETLNLRSHDGVYEITAMSCAQYPHVQEKYAITACGASLGDRYGPKLIAREPTTIDELRSRDVLIAVPGERTSAFGVTTLMLGRDGFRHAVVPFEAIIERVAAGEFDAGLVIHEGQLTFEQAGLHLVVDVGAWWAEQFDLPLPLGVNAIRRDLNESFGPGTMDEVTVLLRQSVEFALAHRAESIDYALGFARDMGADLADEFVAMYVNTWTLDFGEQGRAAVERFLAELHAAGLTPSIGQIEFVGGR